MKKYRCLYCLKISRFKPDQDVLTCQNCGKSFRLLENEIPVFITDKENNDNFYGAMFAEQAMEYDGKFDIDSAHGEWVLKRLLKLEPKISTYAGKTILEIGAGTGLLTRSLAQNKLLKYRKLYVSDISAEMLLINWHQRSLVEQQNQVEYMIMNVLNMPFADASIDMVIGFDILHHVLNYPMGLTEIARVLKPNGVCVLKEPYREAYLMYSFFAKILLRMNFLSLDEQKKLQDWQHHFFTLINHEDKGNHHELVHCDDKYFFTKELLTQHALNSGFNKLSECNVLERKRSTDLPQENLYTDMIVCFFKELGLSEKSLEVVTELANDLDATVGEQFLRDYPVNTLFLLWKSKPALYRFF